jgi:hypothetical protein
VKDRLGKARAWNIAPRNPTQTFYARFLKGPGGTLKSQFTASKEEFEKFGEDALKTRYTRMMEE